MSVAVLFIVTTGAVVALKFGLVGWAALVVLPAAYAVGVSAGRRAVLIVFVLAVIGFALAATFLVTDWWTGLGPMVPALLLAGMAVGVAVRSRRELSVARAEQVRRDERLRIAQDVHDLVAHHIAVVNVQAGAASHLLEDHPEKAAAALEHVTTASAKVLDELGVLLGVLRDPVPGLAGLPDLLGDDVTLTVIGTRRPLPATVDTTAYRAVRESLTNARKHGTGPVQLRLEYTPDQVIIEIRNKRGGGGTGTGYGLMGMRERVTLLGGSVTAGPEGDEFVVRVVL